MDIKKIYLVYFSPGGNTEKVVKLIGNKLTEELGADVNTIDFTLPEMRNIYYTFAEDELAVFGMPTYAGRVPNKLLSFLKEGFKGKTESRRGPYPPVSIPLRKVSRKVGDGLGQNSLERFHSTKEGFKVTGKPTSFKTEIVFPFH